MLRKRHMLIHSFKTYQSVTKALWESWVAVYQEGSGNVSPLRVAYCEVRRLCYLMNLLLHLIMSPPIW